MADSAPPWQQRKGRVADLADPITHDAIPQRMREAARWLLYRLIERGRPKPDKVPFYESGEPRSGEIDGPADVAQLVSFDAALAALRAGGFSGLGFALGADASGNAWQGIDLDGVRDPESGELAAWVQSAVERAGSFSEVSPSGTGIHIVGYGAAFDGFRAGKIEAYCARRYFTVTGACLANAGVLGDVATLARELRARAVPVRLAGGADVAEPGSAANLLDAREVERLRDALRWQGSASEREGWLRVGMGLHAATGGGEQGFALWCEWSQQADDKFNLADTRRVWRSFKPRDGGVSAASLYARAKAAGWTEARKPSDAPREEQGKAYLFNRERAQLDGQVLEVEPPAPPFVVERYLPRDAGTFVAQGGTGKTSVSIAEALHIVLAMPLYGREIAQPGPVLFVSAEETRSTLERMAYYAARDMELSPEQRRTVGAGLLIEDTTRALVRFVHSDRGGNLTQTPAVDELIEEYAGAGLSAIFIDPFNLFSAGERFVNDAEAEMLRASRRISAEIGCAVRIIAHTSKAGAREGQDDQYAGRGGAALADNSRFVHYLARHELAMDERYFPPSEITQAEIESGAVLRLTVPKLSSAPRPRDTIWLRREGFRFRYIEGPPPSAEVRSHAREGRVMELIRKDCADGAVLSPTQAGARVVEAGIASRDVARAVISKLIHSGVLVVQELPEGARGRGRTRCVLPADVNQPQLGEVVKEPGNG